MLDFVLELIGDILDQLFLTPWVQKLRRKWRRRNRR